MDPNDDNQIKGVDEIIKTELNPEGIPTGIMELKDKPVILEKPAGSKPNSEPNPGQAATAANNEKEEIAKRQEELRDIIDGNDQSRQLPETAPENLNKDFVEQVLSGAKVAYAEVSKKLGMDIETVHASRRCEDVSEVLNQELQQAGIESTIGSYDGWDITNHAVVIVEHQGERVLIDPTWQQFLEKPDASKPRVLMMKPDEIDTKLPELGVPAELHHIWKQVKAVSTPTT